MAANKSRHRGETSFSYLCLSNNGIGVKKKLIEIAHILTRKHRPIKLCLHMAFPCDVNGSFSFFFWWLQPPLVHFEAGRANRVQQKDFCNFEH